MAEYPIAVIVGSLRRDSFNRKLADALAKLAPSEFLFKQARIDDLPLYNQDDDAQPAESVQRLKADIAAARRTVPSWRQRPSGSRALSPPCPA